MWKLFNESYNEFLIYYSVASYTYVRQYMFCLLFIGFGFHFKNMRRDYKESQNVRLFCKLPLTSIWDKQMRSLFFCMFLLPCSFVTDVNVLLQIFIMVLWWSRLHEKLSRSAVQEITRPHTDSEFRDSVDKIQPPVLIKGSLIQSTTSYRILVSSSRACVSQGRFSFRLYQPVFYRLVVSLWLYNPPWYDYPISRVTSWSTKELWFDFQQVQVSLSFPKSWPPPPHSSSCSIGTWGSFPGNGVAGAWSWPLTFIHCHD